ncbi:uncharacterized protein LOC127240165 isoform X2 [Andrographis paniculata]|uniref:uncharacterized protein LOC127240165 isoform X2 n=1 Tax=Andrographis paniculata TaxID=175694 RepID=UPI0021E7DBB9|nr:uncharacterized protein LOC127240165 isoform X2 [Andrographis paniculata]
METAVDVVGNQEAEVEDYIASGEAADPVVYQLVRVDGNGILVPATDDEVMAVEDLLDDCKSKFRTLDTGQTLQTSTDYGCAPCDSRKDQVKGSEGKEQLEAPVDAAKPNVPPVPTVDQDERIISSLTPNSSDKSVSQSGSPEGCVKLPGRLDESQPSSSTVGPGLKPDFSLLNGEIHLECLSVRDLQETFRATFGRETSVKDKQWLKRRIIMGLTNSCDFSTTSFVIIDNKVVRKGKEQTCKSADCSVSIDCVSPSAIESHQSPTSLDDTPVEIPLVADETNSQSSSHQDIHGSQDASMEHRPTKRIRKPTKRYIEELSEGETKDSGAKPLSSIKQPLCDRSPAAACAKPLHNFTLDGKCLIRKDSIGGTGIQVPYVSRTRRSRPRENFMALMKLHPSGIGISTKMEENDVTSCEVLEKVIENEVVKNCSSSSRINELVGASPETCNLYVETEKIELEEVKNVESCKTDADDEPAAILGSNSGTRRKHHRPWTLSEVVKLVEGVAKYGAGRWSVIKRLAFASYSYRTSVDLKDKWRNLLRASLSELATGNVVHGSRKQASVLIPAPILTRVRELANIEAKIPSSSSPTKPDAYPNPAGTAKQEAPRSGFL